jgi:hypothetical protein
VRVGQADGTVVRLDREPLEAARPRRDLTAKPVVAWALAALGLVTLLVGMKTLVIDGGLAAIGRQEPLDLDINMVAADRAVHHQPLYDRSASRAAAVKLGGPSLEGSYTVPTNGFAGPPSTALLHVPFLAFDHETGVLLFRLCAAIGMLGAIALTASTLPKGSRSLGALLGTGAMVGSMPLVQTLQLGQGHEFVMLGLAAGLWGVANKRWRIAGAGIGLATALKVSPGILLVYLLLRGKREAFVSGLGAMAALTFGAAAFGRPQDVLTWLRGVVPGISRGVVQSTSLPAVLTRLTSSHHLRAGTELGSWRYLALPLLMAGTVVLARVMRNREMDPLELGVLILLGLVVGPLTWGHYTTWVALPLVLLADRTRWESLNPRQMVAALAAVGVALSLLTLTGVEPSAAAIRADWTLLITSMPYLLAEVLLLVVAVGLLMAGRARAEGEVRDGTDRNRSAVDALDGPVIEPEPVLAAAGPGAR